jgi:hypothetical protein
VLEPKNIIWRLSAAEIVVGRRELTAKKRDKKREKRMKFDPFEHINKTQTHNRG